MASLIENILSLEKEADRLVDDAHARSKDILKSADDEFSLFREQETKKLEGRIAHLREKHEKEYNDHVSRASQEHARKMKSVQQLSEQFVNQQVNKIIDRFNNW